jgi:hypothetical protein
MPDPLLYLKAIGVAAIVSALSVLTMVRLRKSSDAEWLNSASVLGLIVGLALGYYVLALQLVWPPVNGLDRFLTLIVPAALAIEMIAGCQRVSRPLAWLLRMSLAAAIPRVLLHGSVYLSGDEWTFTQAVMTLATCATLLVSLWGLLSWLSHRSPGVSVPLALIQAILCAGLTVMMAGYIKGGAAALPLAAALVATTIAVWLIGQRSTHKQDVNVTAILGIGVVSLFGLLFIGRFFGRLSTFTALTILLVPLLCWATEIPSLRHRKPWIVGSLRLLFVAIPLLVVLTLAKQRFDRDMLPLLGKVQAFIQSQSE